MTQENWETRFERQFPTIITDSVAYGKNVPIYTELKSFISTELEKAYQKGKEEERDRIIKIIEEICNKWVSYHIITQESSMLLSDIIKDLQEQIKK